MQQRTSPAKLLLFVLLVGGIVAFWYWRGSYGAIGQVSRLDFSTVDHIAFLRKENGKVDLFLAKADGSEIRPFTSDGRMKRGLAWSPDGKRLCFTAELRDQNSTAYQLFLLGAGDVRQATYGSLSKDAPAWSPDGKHIAFLAGGSSRVMSPNAAESRQVYPPPHKSAAQEMSGGDHDHDHSSSQPGEGETGFRKAPITRFRWAPNSISIAGRQETEGEFALTRGEAEWWQKPARTKSGSEMTVMPAESAVVLRSITESAVIQLPGGDRVTFDWFPDSKRLLLAVSGPGDSHGLIAFRVDERGLPPGPLVLAGKGAYSFMNPVVSPDGSRVAFELWREAKGGDREMVGLAIVPGTLERPIVLSGESDLAQVSFAVKGDAHEPSWSPDGTRLLYWSNRGNGRDYFVVPAAGGEPTCVTGRVGDNFAAVWSPAKK